SWSPRSRWRDAARRRWLGGGPLHPCTLTSRWRQFLRRQRLPAIRFHDLRHAHATLMLAQGVHPKVVSERLGHASIGITLDLYSSVLPSLQTEAAQAIDELFTSRIGRGARRGSSLGLPRTTA